MKEAEEFLKRQYKICSNPLKHGTSCGVCKECRWNGYLKEFGKDLLEEYAQSCIDNSVKSGDLDWILKDMDKFSIK